MTMSKYDKLLHTRNRSNDAEITWVGSYVEIQYDDGQRYDLPISGDINDELEFHGFGRI